MAPMWTQPPQQGRRFFQLRRKRPKAKRKLPSWTGNALVTALISAIVSGVFSFAVVHYQIQDADRQVMASQQASDRQAAADQQVQEVIHLQVDIQALYHIADQADTNMDDCAAGRSLSSCNRAWNSVWSIFGAVNDTLTVDQDNVSDPIVADDLESFEVDVFLAFLAAGDKDSGTAWVNMDNAYDLVMERTGQLIQREQ